MLAQDENMILQLLISISFITELHKSKFLESKYFEEMHFDNASIKMYIEKIKIDNQGMLLMYLYSLLLVPKEVIYLEYQTDYDLLDKKIDSIKTASQSTYQYDKPNTQYIKHIRNALAHGKVEYIEKNIVFKDNYNDKNFFVELPLEKIGLLLNEMQIILNKYIEDLKLKYKSQ